MKNVQDIIFIWIRTYRKIFQICMSVPLSIKKQNIKKY